jgi:predicted phage tail protein
MIEKKHLIRGAKGNDPPPSPPQPTREPDTLHSRQFATFLDLVSEGEIEGFATASKEGRTKGTTAYNNAALKDVFLNDTPILGASADSTNPQTTDFNFQDVKFTPRFGTGSQTKIPGIESSVSTTSVGVDVTASTPVTRQITNTNVDAVKVSITFAQLQKATNEGDLLGSEVQLKISVQYNSGGFTDVITDTIRGRSGDAYQKDYRVNITGAFPVDVRVSRITADSTDTNLRDSFQWTSFGEIIDDASTYLNSAYSSIRLDSMQFSAIPRRKFRIRGIKVRIPGAGASSSGTPSIDSTNGRIVYPDGYIFNGVMGAAVWTSCPAMILLDLLTNTRYGFGDHITDSSLDLFSFVAASKFANTLVDDGFGGQEPRFSCNVNIQSPSEAFDLINSLSGVMRCMPIWSAGTITITQDKPADPSYLFNLANVTEEGFNYSGSSLKTRHSVVSVAYFNMDSQEIDYEVVEDATAKSKIGTVVKQIKAFACTSRGQARRLGKAVLFAEQNESEVVAFSTSIDSGAVVRPGAIIEINDPVRAGVRRGGRLKTVTSTTVVTVDDTNATDLPTTGSPTLGLILPDGTFESKSVSSISGGTITVSEAFSQTPNVNTAWLLSNTSVEPQLFRVITVEEQDGINYSITALSYVEGKYAFIEDGETIPTRTTSNLTELKDPPSGLAATEQIFPINNQAVSKIVISWQPIVGVTQYQVNYRFGDDNFISEKVSRPDFEIMNSRKGTYDIQVFSYNVLDQLSATSTSIQFEALGKTAVPQDVTGLLVEPVSDQFVRLRFDKATDIDVTHGGNVVVRHSNLTDGTGTFTNSVDIIPALPGNVSETLVPAVDGEYILKFRDDGGRLSSGETSVVVTTPDPQPKLLIFNDREDTDSPPFAGLKSDCFFSDEVNGLVLGSTETLDDATDFDAIADFDFIGDVDFLTGGSYDFAKILDLGAVNPLRLTRHFVTQGFYPNDLIDKRTANIDTWTDFDAATAFNVNAKLLVATTTAAPSNGLSYQDSDFSGITFNTFANGTYVGRGFKFRCLLESEDPAQSIEIDQLGYKAELDRRTEQKSNLSSGTSASGLAVTFDQAFFTGAAETSVGVDTQKPSIGITANDLGGTDRFEITNISGSGFNIKFLNAGNAVQDKTFSYTAVGFGRGS